MAKSNATPAASATLSPIVAAILAGRNRASIGEQALSLATDAVSETTFVVGRLAKAVDTDRFSDGMRTQEIRNYQKRADYWKQFGSDNGLSDEDVAALLNS